MRVKRVIFFSEEMDLPTFAMRKIVKRFPGVVANSDVDLTIAAGEIHALLGENGAGKSTLMQILYGFHSMDSGQILIDGEPVEIASTRDAIALGIGMVHQEFMLVRRFSRGGEFRARPAGVRPAQGRTPAAQPERTAPSRHRFGCAGRTPSHWRATAR